MAIPYIPKRYILATLAHFGFFVVYALRVNLSVALVAMVNATYAGGGKVDPECQVGNKTTNQTNSGEFNWNQNEQGYVLSSFFYGYLVTQIPGGYIASKYGGKWVFGLGVLGTAALTLITPVAARASFYLFLVVRVLEGVGEGVTFPAMHGMIAQWAPPVEQTKMAVYCYAGMYLGTIIALPVSGILAASSLFGGWPSVFYVFGITGFVWFAFWTYFISNTPEEHPTISWDEKRYIRKDSSSSGKASQKAAVPWLKIIKSMPVWAGFVAHFCNNWLFYMILTGLPSYFKLVLDFNLKENGFLSALPFIVSFFVALIGGVVADHLRKHCMSTTKVRKMMTVFGFYPSGILLILASYTSCSQIGLSVACMTLATGALIFNQSGYMPNLIDLSPNFSGILMGLMNFWGTVAGCITPSVTGYFTNNHPTRHQYQKVFFIAAAICFFGGTFFLIFGTGERQEFDNITDQKTDPESNNSPVQSDTDDECLLNPSDDNHIVT